MMTFAFPEPQLGLKSLDGTPLVLESATLRGDVLGQKLDARLTQRFRNPSECAIEVVYTFPLPVRAYLLGVSVSLGERRLTGCVVARQRAVEDYEATIIEGDTAILLERNPDQSYTLNLGNLASGERCEIEIHFVQLLVFDRSGLRLNLPTVIAPRYGDPLSGSGLQPHQTVEHDITVRYPFTLELILGMQFSDCRVASSTHPIAFERFADGRARVTLARAGALDRDFVLSISGYRQTSLALTAPETQHANAQVVLASFCPQRRMTAPTEHDSVRVRILVDCSGSMVGDSIGAAKRALHAFVDALGEADRFALSRFGNSVVHRSRTLWQVSESTKRAARRWIDALDADMGGTNMEGALESVLANRNRDDARRDDVLLITDGHIHDIDSVIARARETRHRVFVVAIGSSPSAELLQKLAEETGGKCDYVSPGESVQEAIERMFGRLLAPRCVALQLDWPEGVRCEWVSPIGSSVFANDTLTVAAMVEGVTEGAVALRGRWEDRDELEILASATLHKLAGEDTLSRLVAAIRVDSLIACADADKREAARTLAIAHQLICDETAYLLIHERAEHEKVADLPELVKVKSMLPAGFGGFGKAMVGESVMPNYPDVTSSLGRPRIRRSVRSSITDDPADPASIARVQRMRNRISAILRRKNGKPISPAELLQDLDTCPFDEWPHDFQGLRNIGLTDALIEWIELVGAPNRPEHEAVTLFLAALCQATWWVKIDFSPCADGTLRQAAERMASDDTQALATMIAMVDRCARDEWAKCIDAMLQPSLTPHHQASFGP